MTEISLKDSHEPTTIKEENEDWHDTEADFYDHIRSELWNFYEQRRISRDVERIDDLVQGEKTVDIGSGTGNLVIKFAQRGYKVDAVDISENMLEVLKEKVDGKFDSQIRFHHSEANAFLEGSRSSTDTNPDVICFSSVLHHLPDYFQTLKKSIAQLKPGGVIYVVHEPLPNKVQRKNMIFHYLDNLLTPRSSFKKWRAPTKESDLVDYHIDEMYGIDVEEIQDFLVDQNLEVVEQNKYCIWKSGILSGVDDLFDLNDESDFKIIARKPA